MEQPPHTTAQELSEYLIRQFIYLNNAIDEINRKLLAPLQPVKFMGAWNYTNSTADSDPGMGGMRMNFVDRTLVTMMYFDTLTNGLPAISVINIFRKLKVNDELVMQAANNPSNTAKYTISSAIIEATGYFKVPVVYNSQTGSAFSNNSKHNFAFTIY